MRAWIVKVVQMGQLQDALSDLERDFPSDGQPILTFVDQSRIIIAWPYTYAPPL